MNNTITLNPNQFENTQVSALAADLTEQYGEYGKRYTPEQVRRALWQALETLIDNRMDDLEALMQEDHNFDQHLGEPETWDDPRAALCECGHPLGDHDEGDLQICLGGTEFLSACACRQFRPKQ